jgi:hypothetical protein
MTRIVTSRYRYKPPPRRKKAAALEVPAVVKAADPERANKRGRWQTPTREPAAPSPPANDDPKPEPPPAASAIVTIRSRKHVMLAHLLEDLTCLPAMSGASTCSRTTPGRRSYEAGICTPSIPD